jgi:hypothetical protein
MGGTRDGEVYDILSEKHKLELKKRTNQTLVSLNSIEAELAKLIDDKTESAKMFKDKAETNKDLENEMREWLNNKGKKGKI